MERARTRKIHEFILDQAAEDSSGLAARVAQAYGISRQAANRHLDLLVAEGLITQDGNTRAKRYGLRCISSLSRELRVTPVLSAERVWDDHAAPILNGDTRAVGELCRGAFGELVRNAVRHAGASWITVSLFTTARHIEVSVVDDGVGIFARLAPALATAGPLEAAEEIAHRARSRISGGPMRRLPLLARNFDVFLMRANGVECEYRAVDDAWVVRSSAEPTIGSWISFRCLRAARGSARTSLPSRPR